MTDALDQHLAAFAIDLQHAAGLALITSGDDLDGIVLLRILTLTGVFGLF